MATFHKKDMTDAVVEWRSCLFPSELLPHSDSDSSDYSVISQMVMSWCFFSSSKNSFLIVKTLVLMGDIERPVCLIVLLKTRRGELQLGTV